MPVSIAEQTVMLRLTSSTDVGSRADDRIWPIRAPSTSIGADYITYQRVSGVYNVTHDTGGPSFQQSRVQVDSRSPTYAGAKALAKSVRKRLVGYRGSTAGGQVWHIRLENEMDIDESGTGDDAMYRVMQDYMVDARVST